MKTPLLEYVPLEEDEEKGTVTNTTTTTTKTPQEEDERDPEFIAFLEAAKDFYNSRKRHQNKLRAAGVMILLLVVLTLAMYNYHVISLRDPSCTNERGQTLFAGQPYTIYATGNNDTIYSPTAITVPSEEHCTYLKQCSKSFANVLCFVKPSYVKMLWTLDIEEEDTGALPPINQYNAGL